MKSNDLLQQKLEELYFAESHTLDEVIEKFSNEPDNLYLIGKKETLERLENFIDIIDREAISKEQVTTYVRSFIEHEIQTITDYIIENKIP